MVASSGKTHHGTSWVDMAWLMLSDIVGTSVLTFTGVATRLGWAFTVLLILGMFPVSVYVALLMSRTRQLLVEIAACEKLEPPGHRMDTMGEVAHCTFRKASARSFVNAVVYGYTMLGSASYLLVIGMSLQMVFHSASLCLTTAVTLGCVSLLVPIFTVRRLGESVLLCFVNTLLIVVVVVVALLDIAAQDRSSCRRTYIVPPGLTFMQVFGAATNILYAYSGQWMYFELMQTMWAPEDFPRTFLITGPFVIVVYLAVALLGYGLGAQRDDLVSNVARGGVLSLVAALLFAHVAIVYLIKSVVITRYFHHLLSPVDSEANNLTSCVKHGILGSLLLCFSWVVANGVPFFSQLLGLIGGFFAGPINFLLPIVFYVLALGRHCHLGDADLRIESCEIIGHRSDMMAEGGAQHHKGEEPSTGVLLRAALRKLPAWEVLLLGSIVAFVATAMVFGVAEELLEIIRLEHATGTPFACHALPPGAVANRSECR